MKYEIELEAATINRLQNLATSEEVTPSFIIQSLLDRHMRVINTAATDSNNYIEFINLLGEYMQEDLESLSDVTESDEDRKMYHVFQSLFAHTLDNQIMIADLYDIYKKA